MKRRIHTVRSAFAIAGGWLLFFVLWTLFLLGWGRGEISVLDASFASFTVTISSAILSPLVWKFTERIEWPGTVSLAFFTTHVFVASIFSILWTVLAPSISLLIEGQSLTELEWDPRVHSWRLMMGIWLYVIMAGLSYTARISSRLRVQQEKAQQAETLAAKANLAAMRNQLQPHFLFNALHSVSSLIDTDAERASEAMEKLGDLLRYAILDKESDLVDLTDEWQFVKDYVDLQKLRYDDSLVVEMIDRDVDMLITVPAFTLQPLVENAFIHGISEVPIDGHIRIEATVFDEALNLSVEDNGSGHLQASQTNGNGTGIANLKHRLSALYGSSANVEITRIPEGGTRATITIPID